MADTLTATIKASVAGTWINTLTNSEGSVAYPFSKEIKLSTTDGTTTGKADQVWASKGRSLSGASAEDIDCFDLGSINIGTGAGENALGNAMTFAEIVLLFVENNSTSTGNLTIGNKNATTAWQTPFNASDTGAVGPIKPGGFFMLCEGADPAFAVADTSDHLLTMTSSDTLTYDIYIIGRSA